MFCWGEESERGFLLKHTPTAERKEGVQFLRLDYKIRDVSLGSAVVAFVKTDGTAVIIPSSQSPDGRGVRGKQKFVKCKHQFQAVSCGDGDEVTLLTESGQVLYLDTTTLPLIPRPVDPLLKIHVCQVACGAQHSVVLTKDGQVYTWGQNNRGQLGLGSMKPKTYSPRHLRSLSATPLVHIAAGGEQSFAVSVSGSVFGWGRNHRGQLGLGDTSDRHEPTPVKCLDMKKCILVSCGSDHTATLTKDGAVFTFGSGQFGQLGHNSFRDELRPRLVAELLGAKVIKIACGQHHTLAMTDSRRVYSFGSGEQGQLGHGEESHPSVPLPVQLLKGGGAGPNIRNIFAGGNCSYATCQSKKEPNTDTVSNVSQTLDDMIDKWTSTSDSKSWKKIKQEIHGAFSSAACLNGSFLEKSKNKHFQTSANYPGLNLSLARLAFEELVKKENVFSEVEATVLQMLLSYQKPVGVEGLRVFLLLTELLHVMQRNKRPQSLKFALALAAAMLSISAENLQIVGKWWISLSASSICEHLTVWKNALSVILSVRPVPRDAEVRNLLLVLRLMHIANGLTTESRRMPESHFLLPMYLDFLQGEVLLWNLWTKQKGAMPEPLILCHFPMVMNVQSKKTVFDLHSQFRQEVAMQAVHFQVMDGFEPSLPQELTLELGRETILEDIFEQLESFHHSYFQRPLVVYFDEIFAFDNVHTKDLFHYVFHEMVSAESGMFVFNDSNTLAWFPSRTTVRHHKYFLFGVLCGLAMYNACVIHLPFPMALFKKMLDVKPSLEDMKEFCPDVGKSLQSVLEEYTDADLKSLDMDFWVSWDGAEVDLDPRNPGKVVTSQTKKEFVDAYVNYAFNTAVESVFMEFKQGFYTVCEKDMVHLFRPEELQEVLVGKDFHAWERLKQNTSYEGGYHADHPNIKMFWEVFDELSEDQKKAFLWFVTGFERVPIHGLANITMVVRLKHINNLHLDEYYPESETCFSLLDLPLYSTKEIMQSKLAEALSRNHRIYR